ncbi:MAG: hypothetical protein ACC700_10350 [Anaerolineales bacterium]
MFEVVDTGGAYGPGEQRIDVFHEDAGMGLEWYNDTYPVRLDGFTIYVQRPIPPEFE